MNSIQNNRRVTDNAAKRDSHAGLIFEKGVRQVKSYILSDIKPNLMGYHTKGYIHIHDLEGYGSTYNCLTLSVVESFPYEKLEHMSSTKKILFILQYYQLLIGNIANEQTGGIAFANFDQEISDIFTRLSIEANVHNLAILQDCIDSFIYWINYSVTRNSRECYYVSLNLGLSTTIVGRHVNKSVLGVYKDVSYIESVIRPNIIFKVHDKINFYPESPNYDLLKLSMECTAKRMNPTYMLCSSSPYVDIDPRNLSIVGCRTRVITDLFGESTSIGRGNIANISINLPRIALEVSSTSSEEERYTRFKERWTEIADITKEILLDRYQRTIALHSQQFPANNEYQPWCVSFPGQASLEEVFKHGTLSIGFIGLSEAIEVLTGQKYYGSDDNYQTAIDFVTYMRNKINEYSRSENLNMSLLATSGEHISSRFHDIDKQLYESSIFDKGYYTNSFHVEVDSRLHPFKKIMYECKFHNLCNGGSITYVELGSAPLDNIEALYDIIDYAHNAGIFYLGFNYPLDICRECGTNGTFDTCSGCDSQNIMRIRRVSGYLEDLSYFGKGKTLEEKNRKVNPI
ncbi:hypothetical protein CN481_15615 [Bacillus sp. AFS006103]|nr:hypothetical protein CN481_15615 [Bacillus sp. AFS006103]